MLLAEADKWRSIAEGATTAAAEQKERFIAVTVRRRWRARGSPLRRGPDLQCLSMQRTLDSVRAQLRDASGAAEQAMAEERSRLRWARGRGDGGGAHTVHRYLIDSANARAERAEHDRTALQAQVAANDAKIVRSGVARSARARWWGSCRARAYYATRRS